MSAISVHLGERTYSIEIGADSLGDLGPRMRGLALGRRAAVVTNPVVARHYRDPVVRSLEEAQFEPSVIEIPEGEEHKNLASLSFLYDRFLDARMERDSPVVALGGGVVGDLAGFAAATFLRGVPLVQVPTTLLAQVDSSVGGKTGVNHAAGKNLIGAFYQPHLVWIDVRTLQTLPERELKAGLAEVIKYGIISSPQLFELLENEIEGVLARHDDLLVRVVEMCCSIKAEVVAADEREAGLRSILNFGHTLGHAIESVTEYRRFLHGEAVAIGMVFAARLSAARGLCESALADRIVRLIERAGLPVSLSRDLVGQPLVAAVEMDKKVAGGKVKFVCVERLGQTRFELLTSEEILRHADHLAS